MLLLVRAWLLLGSAALLLHACRKSGRRLRLVLDPSALFTDGAASFQANASLSPWTYTHSYVPSRLPERISQAVCSTDGCLDPRGGGEDAALRAQPIKYQVLVLHRVRKRSQPTKRKGRPKSYFRLGTQVVTVGCTCVRPSVVTRQ